MKQYILELLRNKIHDRLSVGADPCVCPANGQPQGVAPTRGHLPYYAIPLLVTIVLLSLTLVHNTYAHRIIFFAWVEDGQIHTEGSFPGKKKVKNCQIIVRDEQSRIIHEGKTDDQGRYSFKIPDGADSDLILTLKAGEGHQGEWRIPESELSGSSPPLNKKKVEEKLKSGPSALKIISGIALIFLLAGAARLLLKKKG